MKSFSIKKLYSFQIIKFLSKGSSINEVTILRGRGRGFCEVKKTKGTWEKGFCDDNPMDLVIQSVTVGKRFKNCPNLCDFMDDPSDKK